MAIYTYRINGGQVLEVTDDPAHVEQSPFIASITNPSIPDGGDLDIPKIVVGNMVRNATEAEIANFAVAAAEDQLIADRAEALNWLNDPIPRKILRAIVSVLLDEINTLRANPTQTLAPRTLTQAYTAITNKINAGLVD